MFLTPSNVSSYQRGHAQHVREGPRLSDGNRTLVADLVITDPQLISDVLAGRLREISTGYDCAYEERDGKVHQTSLRANHVAVVEAARANAGRKAEVKIMDSARGTMIDWKRNKEMPLAEALVELDRISRALKREDGATHTQDKDRQLQELFNGSEEGRAFADAARAFHRKAISIHDCRPALRQIAEERRQSATELSPEELASSYALAMREFHRK